MRTERDGDLERRWERESETVGDNVGEIEKARYIES